MKFHICSSMFVLIYLVHFFISGKIVTHLTMYSFIFQFCFVTQPVLYCFISCFALRLMVVFVRCLVYECWFRNFPCRGYVSCFWHFVHVLGQFVPTHIYSVATTFIHPAGLILSVGWSNCRTASDIQEQTLDKYPCLQPIHFHDFES